MTKLEFILLSETIERYVVRDSDTTSRTTMTSPIDARILVDVFPTVVISHVPQIEDNYKCQYKNITESMNN